MSFITGLALAVGLLVFLPLLAHLLRRGKTEEHEFPAAVLVPERAVTAQQRSRLEDRLLFALRALMVLALAVLGATPLIRCSRLNMARPSGASVALALVIDDSQSMQSEVEGGTRWELALTGARELLASARAGDAVAIVRAGRPARVALSPTTDLAAAKHSLSDLQVTDRSTDLGNAVRLAQALLKPLPQQDKRVLVLSDLADALWDSGDVPVLAPLQSLRSPVHNCGITSAEQQGESIAFTVACSSPNAAQGRSANVIVTALVAAAGPSTAQDAGARKVAAAPAVGTTAGSLALGAQAGVRTLRIPLKRGSAEYEVVLTGSDANPADDKAAVAGQASQFTVAVVADPAKATVVTGGATVIEQGLAAVSPETPLKPLLLIPEDSQDLQPYAVLVIDDPPGLSPEARSALEDWLLRGGVAVGFLGPGAQSVQLSSSLAPFANGGHWEATTTVLSASEKTAAWLESDADILKDLSRAGRMRLDGAELSGSTVALRWQDDVPLAWERALGGGVVLTFGLPVSVEISDLSLRPVFLSTLQHALELARARHGPSQSPVGSSWNFRNDAVVEVTGPQGPLPVQRIVQAPPSADPAAVFSGAAQPTVVPERTGRYQVKVDGVTQKRIVTLDAEEITRPPGEPPTDSHHTASPLQGQVDISREVAFLLLALLTLETLLRALSSLRLRKQGFS